uniref:Uncharacterized protein n=1 Tax=Kalanchoe fedtschenkoi TaxID=63787 RepID=A0A7N0UYK3_KALFE
MLGLIWRNLLLSSTATTLISPRTIILRNRRLLATATSRVAKQRDDGSNSTDRVLVASTISYLVDSCGLNLDAAKRAAKFFRLHSTGSADEVVALLRDYGFSDAHISTIVQKRPSLLLADPDKTLRPKFECLASIGGSHDVILKVVLRCPEMLFRNLDRDLVPSLEFLKSILHTDENVLMVIARCHWLLRFNLPAIVGPNVESLRNVGLSDKMIMMFLKSRPTAFLSSTARFREVAIKVKEMGFDPDKYNFHEAINVFLSVNEKTWDRKVEIFNKWGWTDAEVLSAFKKQPRCMLQSDNKVEGIMDYLVNNMELRPSFAAQNPNVLMCSLKQRIIPRCSIIRHLLLKGVMTGKDFKFSSVLIVSEPYFLSTYLTKHKERHPELLDLYNKYKEGMESCFTHPI